MNTIEILCPAGDFEAVVAAVQNGGDAVYLGQKKFSARQNAKNFDQDDLRRAVSYCHARGVLVYLAINTLIHDNQIESVKDSIQQACNVGIDAFIVQDLGVLTLVKQMCPSMPIHASTQMAVHTIKGAELLKQQGVARVVLARELSYSEITEIVKAVPMEYEVFVHGALCMSVSGQCYMSGMIGTRSGNRGNCAGTCRLPFSVNGRKGDYDLSLKDMCLTEYITELMEIGVTSLKIEGRMKRPEYVAVTAKAYDDARKGIVPNIDTVQAVFSRSGFTDGYFTGNVNGDMFGYRQKEDVVSATNKVLKSLANTYKKESPRVGISFFAIIQKGKPVMLTVSDEQGNIVTVSGEIPEVAINTPMNRESLIRSLSKLGGTPFFFKELECILDDGLVVSTSAINELRRKACEQVLAMREQITPVPCKIIEITLSERDQTKKCPFYRGRFAKSSQVAKDKISWFDKVILPIDEVYTNQSEWKDYQDKIIIEPHRIMFGRENEQYEKLKALKNAGYLHLQAENLAHIQMGKELGYEIHGGAYLNCLNSYTAHTLTAWGLSDITLSFELELSKANTIQSNIPLGMVLYGSLPLMIMRNCPVKAKKGCQQCGGKSTLTDRMDKQFPVICNSRIYTEVLNSNCLYMSDRMHEVRNSSFGVLYFTNESQEQILKVMKQYENNEKPSGEFTRGLYYRSI